VCLLGVEKGGLQFSVSRLFLAHRDFKLLETPVCVLTPALQLVELAIELRFVRAELIVARLEGTIFLRQQIMLVVQALELLLDVLKVLFFGCEFRAQRQKLLARHLQAEPIVLELALDTL
jgi:hypothetical protein